MAGGHFFQSAVANYNPAPAGGGYDTDAQAYIDAVVAAGGTLDSSQQDAINTLYLDLKSNSLYTEMLYMYPFMGETAASHAVCGINPGNADYTLTWFENLTNDASHTAAGVNTQIVGTGYGTISATIASIHSSVDDVSLGAYVSTATTGDQAFVVSSTYFSAGNDRYQLNIPYDSNRCYIGIGRSTFGLYNNGSAPVGMWVGSRINSTSLVLYKNGSSVTSNSTTNTGVLNSGSPELFSTSTDTASNGFQGVCGFAFGGNGLDSTQVSNLQTVLSTFFTAIGR